MKSIISRLVASVILFSLFGWVNYFLLPVATIAQGRAAGLQFDNSDSSYIESILTMQFFKNFGIPTIVLTILLICVWWKPFTKLCKSLFSDGNPLDKLVVAIVTTGLLLTVAAPAQAYYDKSDYTEAYFVLPNESAFFVPDVGANKDSQTKLNSRAYYEEKKIAAKRFVIPHTKLDNSGLFSNFYVPSGRLIIVDRAPYSRVWTGTHDRGTSSKNESIVCQSQEGLDVITEVAISASIKEEDSSTYLANFGIQMPGGNRTDPAVIFTSVYHARNLATIMDTTVFTKVHGLICSQVGSRPLDKVNLDSAAIMNQVEKDITVYMASKGITLDAIGWAGTFTFAGDVQKAINDAYIGTKVASAMPVMERQANIEVKRGLAEGLKKGLPSMLPPAISDWLSKMFGSNVVAEPAKK